LTKETPHKKTIKNLKMHTEGFKTTNKERNFNIQEFYKTKIITSMTVNHTNQIRQAQRNFNPIGTLRNMNIA